MLLLRLHNDHFLIACNLPTHGPATFSVFRYHISFCEKAFSYFFPPLNYVLQIHVQSWGNLCVLTTFGYVFVMFCVEHFFSLCFSSAPIYVLVMMIFALWCTLCSNQLYYHDNCFHCLVSERQEFGGRKCWIAQGEWKLGQKDWFEIIHRDERRDFTLMLGY